MKTGKLTGGELLSQLWAKKKTPFSAHLQIADRCNHTCQHCYQVQGEKGELSFQEIKEVLDKLSEAGVITVNISGGEATLRSDLIQILDYAVTRGFRVVLFTNAFLITDSMAQEIAKVGVSKVHVSVYSDIEEQHDAITCVPGSLRKTLAGIRALRRVGVPVVMKTPQTTEGFSRSEPLRVLAKELGCDIIFSTQITPTESGSRENQKVALQGEKLLDIGMIVPWIPKENFEEEKEQRLAMHPCGVCRNAVTVLPNGELRPCTDTIVPLGNLLKHSFNEIYENNSTVELLRTVTFRDVAGCRDCDLLAACSRCHAAAVHENGYYLGPYERACETARTRYRGGVGTLEILEPTEECEQGRQKTLGPYKIDKPGLLRPIPLRLGVEDQSRISEFPWLKPSQGYFEKHLNGSSQGLVTLRVTKRETVPT